MKHRNLFLLIKFSVINCKVVVFSVNQSSTFSTSFSSPFMLAFGSLCSVNQVDVKFYQLFLCKITFGLRMSPRKAWRTVEALCCSKFFIYVTLYTIFLKFEI